MDVDGSPNPTFITWINEEKKQSFMITDQLIRCIKIHQNWQAHKIAYCGLLLSKFYRQIKSFPCDWMYILNMTLITLYSPLNLNNWNMWLNEQVITSSLLSPVSHFQRHSKPQPKMVREFDPILAFRVVTGPMPSPNLPSPESDKESVVQPTKPRPRFSYNIWISYWTGLGVRFEAH